MSEWEWVDAAVATAGDQQVQKQWGDVEDEIDRLRALLREVLDAGRGGNWPDRVAVQLDREWISRAQKAIGEGR